MKTAFRYVFLFYFIGFSLFISGCLDEEDDDFPEEQVSQEVVAVNQPQLVPVSPATEIVTTEPEKKNEKDNVKAGVQEPAKPAVSNSTPPDKKSQKAPPILKETPVKVTPPIEKPKTISPPSSIPKEDVVTNRSLETPTTTRGSGSGPKVAGRPAAVMNHESYDFGNIIEGTKVKHTFVLKNIGNQDLLIHDIDAGCSCTTVDYSFESIPPGGSTPIEVTFDSNTKLGTQLKKINISTNAGTKLVKMSGTVFPKDKKY